MLLRVILFWGRGLISLSGSKCCIAVVCSGAPAYWRIDILAEYCVECVVVALFGGGTCLFVLSIVFVVAVLFDG
jgi:hypothetical protein